jgi:hypothetical protein
MSATNWQQEHVETGLYPPVTYLLIDDLHIRRMEGVRRVACPPQKHPEPVVKPEKPWEGEGVWMHNGWLYDDEEQVFKLWYHGHDPSFREEYPTLAWPYRRLYAVSPDARTWEKPNLGVVEWQGSRENNLVNFPPAGGDGPNSNVFKNPNRDEPNSRYMSLSSERHLRQPGERVIIYPGGPDDKDTPNGRGFYLCDSPDGFNWTRRTNTIMSHALCMDGPVLHGFDEDLNAWIVWWRPRIQLKGGPKFRTMGISIASDLEKMPYPQMALVPDDEDAPGTEFDRCGSVKVSGGYVALVRTLFPEYNNLDQAKRDFRHIHCQLAFSRDARMWSRPAGRESVLGVGEPGTWDEKLITPANPIQVGDDIYILYQAGRGETVRGIGLATLKRDRWAAIEPTHIHGVLQTQPMAWANRRLQVNAETAGGSIRAELADTMGRPVPGFTMADSDPFTGDSLDHAMSWGGKSELPDDIIGIAYSEGEPGRVMSIRFDIDRARLYSFSC